MTRAAAGGACEMQHDHPAAADTLRAVVHMLNCWTRYGLSSWYWKHLIKLLELPVQLCITSVPATNTASLSDTNTDTN